MPPIGRPSLLGRLFLTIFCFPTPVVAAEDMSLQIVSSRPDSVSGGNALVQINSSKIAGVQVLATGRDVTSSFRRSERSGKLLSILSGLRTGGNVLELRVNGIVRSQHEIVSHPLSGPIFSGPHQSPFSCETAENGLGAALDENCSAATVVQYYYKSTQDLDLLARLTELAERYRAIIEPKSVNGMPGFKRYDPSAPRPHDMAQVVDRDGKKVDYIVRREIGVINRAAYQILFLHQPETSLPTPWTSFTSRWNGGLVYLFKGGCGAGYHQGALPSIDESAQPLLLMGYAIAASSLSFLANNCNEKLASETASMVREHFIETYGQPSYTIAVGISSGAAAAYLTAQNYPGIVDAIIAYQGNPDHITTEIPVFSDCALLSNVVNHSKYSWTEVQKTAISGFATWQTCLRAASFLDSLGWLDPKGCAPSVSKQAIYDPSSNPGGTRCTYYDNAIDTFGRDPVTGFARRPLDNVGIQYGLAAFNAGKINAEQFIELNSLIGGFDLDGRIVSERTSTDETSVRIARNNGAMLTGKNLNEIPIVDWSTYSDDLGDTHTHDRGLLARLRITDANGNAGNQAIIVTPRPLYGGPTVFDFHDIPDVGLASLVPAMQRWLASISADDQSGERLGKIIRNKPMELEDGCVRVNGERIFETAAFDGTGTCNKLYPIHGNPRVAAGAPPSGNVLKCRLKPINSSDYSIPLTPAQMTELRSVFPSGVCDYTKPGVGDQAQSSGWHSTTPGRLGADMQ